MQARLAHIAGGAASPAAEFGLEASEDEVIALATEVLAVPVARFRSSLSLLVQSIHARSNHRLEA